MDYDVICEFRLLLKYMFCDLINNNIIKYIVIILLIFREWLLCIDIGLNMLFGLS